MTTLRAKCWWLSFIVTAAIFADGANAQTTPPRRDPAVARETPFGMTALFDTDATPNPTKDWNILNFGLFCGTKVIHPGRVVAYVYGIDYQRLQSGAPLQASIDIDGKVTGVELRPFEDTALTVFNDELVRSFSRAQSVSIQIKDYGLPKPDRIKLEYTETRVKSALKKCFKF